MRIEIRRHYISSHLNASPQSKDILQQHIMPTGKLTLIQYVIWYSNFTNFPQEFYEQFSGPGREDQNPVKVYGHIAFGYVSLLCFHLK